MQIIPISTKYFTSWIDGDTAFLSINGHPDETVIFSYSISLLSNKKASDHLTLELAILMLSRDMSNEKYLG
jgi:hypothetical protein